MPEVITIEKTVYAFNELSDSAKDRARDAYRQYAATDDWWDHVYEDAETIAHLLGIVFSQKAVKLHGGGTRYEPKIWFSGFSSQGDGACFEGSYYFKAGAIKAIKTHAPKDKELHRIAQALTDAQKANGFKLQAAIAQRGRYNHSGCMDIEVEKDSQTPIAGDTEDALIQALRDFADWIYRSLEAEHNYLTSNEAADEYLSEADMQFNEDGSHT